MLENILLIIAGFFLLVKGADILVDGATAVAKKLHISSLIIGLTIVAIGTSMPELMICLKSSGISEANVAIGSVVGSNICNILLVLGICSLISPIKFKKETRLLEIPLSLLMIFTVFVLSNNSVSNKAITQGEGIVLLALFVCFLIYTIIIGKYGELLEPKIELINTREEELGVGKSIIFIIAGIVALKFGGDFVVENIKELIENFNIDEKIMSLIVIAIGTSLPELMTSINAILKQDNDMAIGNIIGSNIFNLSLILGLSSIFNPISFSVDYNIDIFVLFITTVVLLIVPYIGKKEHCGRIAGGIFILSYIGYVYSMFLR